MNMDVVTRNLLEKNSEDMPDSQRELILRNTWRGSLVFVAVALLVLIVMLSLYFVNN